MDENLFKEMEIEKKSIEKPLIYNQGLPLQVISANHFQYDMQKERKKVCENKMISQFNPIQFNSIQFNSIQSTRISFLFGRVSCAFSFMDCESTYTKSLSIHQSLEEQ